jgi:hypothetical protein
MSECRGLLSKVGGPGFSSSQFRGGNKIILTASSLAAVALNPHDPAAIKVRAISENSIAFEGIVRKDGSLTFDTIHPF